MIEDALLKIVFILAGMITLGLIWRRGKDLIRRLVNKEKLQDELKELQMNLLKAQEELGQEREKNRTLLSQKKSSETRLGQISEHLVPFLENCRHDPKAMHFLGNPIDYVVFDFDQGTITFLEVKSGNSKPTKRQKVVKNIIKTGRVFYEEIRINEKGMKNRVMGLDGQSISTPTSSVQFDEDDEDEQT